MPEAAEDAMWAEARRKFPGDEARQRAYVYGGLRHKLGWEPRKTAKRLHGRKGKEHS